VPIGAAPPSLWARDRPDRVRGPDSAPAGPATGRSDRVQAAILQSVAVLAGVSPVRPPQPASPARPGSAEGDPLEAARPRRPADRLELSDAWRNRGADGSGTPTAEGADREPAAARAESAESPESTESTAPAPAPAEGGPRGADGEPLSDREQQELQQLRARDTEVRTHEQAHKAVGGRYAGAISYTYTTGPDGRRYVTGGSVPIDMSPIPGDPEATIAKMRIVRAAAMAPAEPSPQDRSVAAAADRAMAQAMTEASKQRMQEAAPDRADRPDGADRDGGGSTGGDAAESRGLTAVAGASERSIDPVRRDAAAAYRSGAEPTPVPGLSLVA
jgi:hypothetical protein